MKNQTEKSQTATHNALHNIRSIDDIIGLWPQIHHELAPFDPDMTVNMAMLEVIAAKIPLGLTTSELLKRGAKAMRRIIREHNNISSECYQVLDGFGTYIESLLASDAICTIRGETRTDIH